MTWFMDLAYGATWEKVSDRCWVLQDERGIYVARFTGDFPDEIRYASVPFYLDESLAK